jgi:Coenzyme PQQ synthesis protein D (PqqD)
MPVDFGRFILRSGRGICWVSYGTELKEAFSMKSIRIAPSVRSAFSSDGAVLMEIRKGMMFTSNPVGGRILELLTKGATTHEVAETISRECSVPREIVLRDFESFADQLQAYGLVECDSTVVES